MTLASRGTGTSRAAAQRSGGSARPGQASAREVPTEEVPTGQADIGRETPDEADAGLVAPARGNGDARERQLRQARPVDRDPPPGRYPPEHSGTAGDSGTVQGAPGEGSAAGSAGEHKRRIVFVDIGRALGALFVVYTHFDWLFLRHNHDEVTWFSKALYAVFLEPLRLTDQGIGAVAVPFFFLASGFVVTPIALRLGTGRFGVNRAFRVYPLLFFVVAVSVAFLAVGASTLTTGDASEITVGSVLTNLSLVNFFDKPMVAYVGVAWTLAVEVLFYLLIMALLPVLRRVVWLAIAIELEIVVLVLSTHAQFGPNYAAFAVNVAYLVMPILGQVIWAVREGKIPLWLGALYLPIGWGLFVWASNLAIDPDYVPRPYPFAVAVVLFLLGLFAERHLRERRVWTALSERTYSIYLLHGAAGFPVMYLVYDHLPLGLTLLSGALATAVAVEISYRLVERPSHNLGRKLSRRSPPTTAGHRGEPVGPTPAEYDENQHPGDDGARTEATAGAERAAGAEGDEERTDVFPLPVGRSSNRVLVMPEQAPESGSSPAHPLEPASGVLPTSGAVAAGVADSKPPGVGRESDAPGAGQRPWPSPRPRADGHPPTRAGPDRHDTGGPEAVPAGPGRPVPGSPGHTPAGPPPRHETPADRRRTADAAPQVWQSHGGQLDDVQPPGEQVYSPDGEPPGTGGRRRADGSARRRAEDTPGERRTVPPPVRSSNGRGRHARLESTPESPVARPDGADD